MLVNNLIKKYDGTFKVTFDPQPDENLSAIGAELTYQLSGGQTMIIGLTSFEDILIGVTPTRTIEKYYSFSKDNTNYTVWTKIGDFTEFIDLDPDLTFYLRLKYKRTGTDTTGNITISKAVFHGIWDIPTDQTLAELSIIDECKILAPIDTYKIFKLSGFNLYASGITSTKFLETRYRFTQNSGRTWSNWELLTIENISTIKVDPLKFFRIEYSACRKGVDINGVIKLVEVELLGEFQNVSDNYKKTNKYGIRSCCDPNQLNLSGSAGTFGFATNAANVFPEDLLNSMCTGANFDPYSVGTAVPLYNYLANGVTKAFGWTATYWKTDIDEKGIDREFHEYQLYNVCGVADIKVMVPENAFPDNQITFNQFDLSLFEAFEIHITKDEFKAAFGLENRPAKQDFLFLCVTNRMYQVEHAQAYRDFLNSSVYYKVVLKKYNNKANVRHLSPETKNALDQLTNNSSLDALLGESNKSEEVRIGKEQLRPLTFDFIRRNLDSRLNIVLEEILNASLQISQYHYNLSNVPYNTIAVDYNKADRVLLKGDNRSMMCWFKLNANDVTKKYYFLDNYDAILNKGYKIWFENDMIHFKYNALQYDLPTPGILNKVWYCFVLSLNQRLNYVEMEVYQRDTMIDVITSEETPADILPSSKLINVWDQVWENSPADEYHDDSLVMKIWGSNMKLTNIRVFTDIIPKNMYTKVLNQKIVKSSDFLILADNAEEKIILPNHA